MQEKEFKNKLETRLIRTQIPPGNYQEHSSPIYLTSSFTFEDAEQGRALFAEELEGNIYSRYSNPNTTEFIEKVCILEKAEDGFAFASGMAAIFASFAAFLQSGDHILSSRSIFGSTHQLLTKILPKWGVDYTYFEAQEPENWESLIKPNTKIVYVETPSNPGLEIIDLSKLQALRAKYNFILIVDNCFATPILQTPIDYDADLIIHSATKYFDGQGRVLGGIVVGTKSLLKEIRYFARHTGGALSPFNAWILGKSLETLPIRIEKHVSNALALASLLENHPQIKTVKYPFLASHPQYALAKKQMKAGGGIVTFEVKGENQGAIRFMNKLKMIKLSSNLGDTRSIITHPFSTTHSKLTEEERQNVSIFPGLIRISVGLENVQDLFNDINQALKIELNH